MKSRFAGRSRSSIGRSMTAKAGRLGLHATSKTKIWTILEMGSGGKALAEGLTDDQAWDFLENHAKERMLGDVPDALKALIETTIRSSVRQELSQQLRPIEKVKQATIAIDQLFDNCIRTRYVSNEEYSAIQALYQAAAAVFAGIDSALEDEQITKS